MKGNQTLEKKRVSNKPGLSPVAKTLHSWAREQRSGLLLWVYILLGVGSGLSSCIIPRTHRQALSSGALDPWTLGWHAIFSAGWLRPRGHL